MFGAVPVGRDKPDGPWSSAVLQASRGSPPQTLIPPELRNHAIRPGKDRCVHSLATQHRDQCQDTASRFLGQCQHTDWIGLRLAMLDRPVGTYGDNVQWAASGGHPSHRANAPPLAPSTWNRNPCWGCSNDGN